MVCNECFIFCCSSKGVISVYSIASGDLVTHLRSGPADSANIRAGCSRVAINKGLVASLSPKGGTVWSVPQMEVVTHVSFVLPNSCHEGEDRGRGCRWSSFEVCLISATKVVVWVNCYNHSRASLHNAYIEQLDSSVYNIELYTILSYLL